MDVKQYSKINLVLLTFASKLMSITVLLYVSVGSLQILNCLRIRVLRATLLLEHLLKLLKASLLKDDLRPEIILSLHLLINALIQADLLVFETGYLTLKLSFIGLLIIRNAFKGVQLLKDLFTFRLQLSGTLLSFFKLAGDMINMSFQSQDLLDVILFLLLMLLELE